MKILLINPPRYRGSSIVREMRCAGLTTVSVYPPIELAYLAGWLRQYSEVKILDANALNWGLKQVAREVTAWQPEAVVFTVSPTSFMADAKIAPLVKKINPVIKIVLLDSHIFPAMPEKTKKFLPEIDYFVDQEPLLNIPKIFGFEGTNDLEKHPLPAYDLLPLEKYSSVTYAKKRPFATLVTSVGCPNRCEFCIVGGATVERGYGKKWRFKSAEKIFSELNHLVNLGVKSVYFFDETFTVDCQRVKDLCQIILDKGVKIDWACNGRVDTLNEEIIKIMKKAGCWNIMFGIECGSEELLKVANKGTTLARAMAIVKCCHDNGILVSASFMLGLPDESWRTIQQTLEVAKRINPHRAQFVILTPYPGTKIYEEVKGNGLLLRDYSFDSYDAYCVSDLPVIRTKNMSEKELAKAQKYIFRKFYLRPSYLLSMLLSIKSWDQARDLIKLVRYLR